MRVKHVQVSILPSLLLAFVACQSTPTQTKPQDSEAKPPKTVTTDPAAESTVVKGKAQYFPRPGAISFGEDENHRREAHRADKEAKREERLARAISRALEYEINGQNMLAIRAYRAAGKFANAAQRNDLESKARKLLMGHLRLEKNKDQGRPVTASEVTVATDTGEIAPLRDYQNLSENELISILKESTPTERLREATGGYNSFLAQAAAIHGQSEASKNQAYARLSVFRKNEARLARLRKLRVQLRKDRQDQYKAALYDALDSADDRFAISDYLSLFKLQDQLKDEMLDSAKIVFRVQLLTRARNGRVLGVGRDSKSRPANLAERQVLQIAHHKAQLRALKKARSLTPESVKLLLRGENLRQQRVMLAASNEALRQRNVLDVYDLAQSIESQP